MLFDAAHRIRLIVWELLARCFNKIIIMTRMSIGIQGCIHCAKSYSSIKGTLSMEISGNKSPPFNILCYIYITERSQ